MKQLRPIEDEASIYYWTYINQVPDDDFVQLLRQSLDDTISFLQSIPGERWNFAYAPGKWTLKEVWIHVIDCERIFAYRALRLARNDQTPLQGFDQDDYIPFCEAENRSNQSVISEFIAVRKATIHLFENLSDKALMRFGIASNSRFSVRALGFIIAGHEIHHLKVIKQKYLQR